MPTTAEQLPYVGSALNWQGQPYEQLQLANSRPCRAHFVSVMTPPRIRSAAAIESRAWRGRQPRAEGIARRTSARPLRRLRAQQREVHRVEVVHRDGAIQLLRFVL